MIDTRGSQLETAVPNAVSQTGLADIEVSVVIPCLDEHETIGVCVEKALRAFSTAGIAGEIVVADNGSTDGSQEIARQAGARVIAVPRRGYGNALMSGIEAARGRFIIMGDADESYDFLELPKFVERLRAGDQLVQGCRLPKGGGRVQPGAMPFLHRWLGNPLFTRQAQVMFGSPVNDIYCGMRGFTKELYHRLQMRCTGMEFAAEMIIKASLLRERISEVPITLWPDGRQCRRPHLRTFRDGWRTLRFFLLYSPRWLFWYPGLVLVALGMLGYALAMPGLSVFGANLDAHTLLFASLALLVGHQAIVFAILATTFAANHGLLPAGTRTRRFEAAFTLERGLITGTLGITLGIALLLLAVVKWWIADFGPLDYASTMRLVIPGVTATTLGIQTVLGSFLCSILSLASIQAPDSE